MSTTHWIQADNEITRRKTLHHLITDDGEVIFSSKIFGEVLDHAASIGVERFDVVTRTERYCLSFVPPEPPWSEP